MNNQPDLVVTRLANGGYAFEVVSTEPLSPGTIERNLPLQFRIGEFVTIHYEWAESQAAPGAVYQHGAYPAPLLKRGLCAAMVERTQVTDREITAHMRPTIWSTYRRYAMRVIALYEGGRWTPFDGNRDDLEIVRPEIDLLTRNPRPLPYAVEAFMDGVYAFDKINLALTEFNRPLMTVDATLYAAIKSGNYAALEHWLNTHGGHYETLQRLCGNTFGHLDGVKLARLINPGENMQGRILRFYSPPDGFELPSFKIGNKIDPDEVENSLRGWFKSHEQRAEPDDKESPPPFDPELLDWLDLSALENGDEDDNEAGV